MAKVTNLTLRNKVIYRLYIRNYSEAGTFQGIIPDLPRLKDLGVSIIVLASIFPATEIKNPNEEKGDPHYVRAFDAVGKEYGTLSDFKALIDAIHAQDMQVVIELPLHHMAKDSEWATEHPDYFLHDRSGNLTSEWPSHRPAYDLNFDNPKMWEELIAIMKGWAQMVDGFYIRQVMLIRPEFLNSARAEIEDIHPYFYWMGGTTTDDILLTMRMKNQTYWTEGEVYNIFDVLDKATFQRFPLQYLEGDLTLDNLVYMLNWHELMLPGTAVKNRGLEIDDGCRFASYLKDNDELESWTALSLFEKGAGGLMMGQEFGTRKPISRTSDQAIAWDKPDDMTPLIQRLSQVKRREICKSGYYFVRGDHNCIVIASYHYYNQHLIGIFKLQSDENHYVVEVGLPKGTYNNLIDDSPYDVNEGRVEVGNQPVILSFDGEMRLPH
ncbi:MAG: alpha-amylase family glycosyl hydrolase [Aerococcus sp.]|nr:alpha-amylase family glycosyl hydrolase [Aerococcus sp.]